MGYPALDRKAVAQVDVLFNNMDMDGDGVITREEFIHFSNRSQNVIQNILVMS